MPSGHKACIRKFRQLFVRQGCVCGSETLASVSPARSRQLLVDVSVIYQHDAGTGIQRVVRALLLQLLETPIEGYDVRPIFATRAESYRYANPDFLIAGRSDTGSNRFEKICVAQGDIFLGLDLAANILPRHEQVIRCWKSHGVSIHLIVYDLLPLFQGKWFHRKTRRHFRRWANLLFRQADGAICISDQVGQDVKAAFAKQRRRADHTLAIRRIRLGGDIGRSVPTRGILPKSHAVLDQLNNKEFVLMIGTIEPRKGHVVALNAFEALWRGQSDPTPLLIVGRPGWKTKRLQQRLRGHAHSGRLLYWLDDASDELIDLLYQKSTGLLVTSYAEGYGLPLIEASRWGKAVLARELTVFREFNRSNICFFQDDRPLPLAASIDSWLRDIRNGCNTPPSAPIPDWNEACMDLLNAMGLTAMADISGEQSSAGAFNS